MTETEINEILQSVRNQLTGNLHEDMLFLQEQVNLYASRKDGDAAAAALTELAISLMPENQLDYMKKVLYIGERRMDSVYAEASRLMKRHMTNKALVLTTQIYDKVMEVFKETNDCRFFSFRNLLESNLYYQLYHPTKTLKYTPFDLPRYLSAHAYNLIEMRRPDEAVPVLEAAIRFNPVNPDPRFELAEAYKVMGQDEKLLTVIKETLPICATPYAISRCYANLGYYCVEVKDYENAVRFYFESLIYADHPAVPAELKHVAMLMGKKITPPTREEVLSAFAAYEIPNGPSQEVVGTATALANQAVEKHEWEEATFYLRVLSDLTHDPETKALLTKCQEQLKK